MKKLLNILYIEGVNEVHAKYIPAAKNNQTALFYDKLGFEALDNTSFKSYKLKLNKQYEIESYYRFEVL